MAPLRVLIVGGGVAGPALAHWLARIDAATSITLIERAPRIRAHGQQVDLRAQGVDVMRKMGIEPAVRAARVREPGAQLVDLQGRTRAFFAANQTGKGRQSVTSEFEIMRGDLVRILFDLTKDADNVTHRFGTTVASLAPDGDRGGVRVTFSDARTETFDVVVGADGTGSRTRRAMLGPEAPDPRRSLGAHIGFFSVPSQPHDSDRFTFCCLPGTRHARFVATRKDCAPLTRVYFFLRGRDDALAAAHKSGSLEGLKKAWADLFRDGGWETRRFVDALLSSPEADDLYSTPMEEVQLPPGSWSRGGLVLVGDAAHGQTANGLGCTWGLIGPYILAGELATALRAGAPPAEAVVRAARKYESIFRPIATATHGGSQFLQDFFTPRSGFGIWMLHSLARTMAYFRLDQVISADTKTAKWQLPEYPGLDARRRE